MKNETTRTTKDLSSQAKLYKRRAKTLCFRFLGDVTHGNPDSWLSRYKKFLQRVFVRLSNTVKQVERVQ